MLNDIIDGITDDTSHDIIDDITDYIIQSFWQHPVGFGDLNNSTHYTWAQFSITS